MAGKQAEMVRVHFSKVEAALISLAEQSRRIEVENIQKPENTAYKMPPLNKEMAGVVMQDDCKFKLAGRRDER